MKSILRKSTTPRSVIIALVCLVAIFFGIFLAARAQAAPPEMSLGQRLITVHDNGRERGLLTHATTLRAAFDEAGIAIDPNDRVEPGLDEKLVANNYEANIYRARPVMIVDGSLKKRVMSPYRTAKQITENAGVTLRDEDIATMTASGELVSQGAAIQLEIDRATSFTLILYGKKIVAYTQKTTVADMLQSKNITVGKNDTLSVSKSAEIKAGMKIELWRNGKQTVTEEQDVAYQVEEIQDADREVGYHEVKTPGQKGKKEVTYEIVMKNGKEISRKEIQSVVTKKPKKEVVVVGTKNNYSGSLNEWLTALRGCETGGNYARVSSNGMYHGAYQFLPSTWDNVASKSGRHDLVGIPPEQANPADQDAMVIANTKMSSGGLASQHPGCYRSLGLSQFPPG